MRVTGAVAAAVDDLGGPIHSKPALMGYSAGWITRSDIHAWPLGIRFGFSDLYGASFGVTAEPL